jgi:hypothetical protein
MDQVLCVVKVGAVQRKDFAGTSFTQEALSASGHVHDLIEQRAEWLGLAVEAAHVGGKASLVVKQRPGDSMFGFSRELAQEGAQAACVALPEGMDRVHLGVVVRQPLQEGATIETLQVVLPSKLGKDALGVACDVLRTGVERIRLRYLDCA